MRYLVKARVKPGKEKALLDAINQGTLGAGSVAGDEYLLTAPAPRAWSSGSSAWTCPSWTSFGSSAPARAL
jgi:hypothetical protein